jgi:hypothetical protein
MKTYLFSIQLALTLAASCCVRGQGFVYDQQISNLNPPGGYVDFSTDTVGQSFIPTLSSIGFVRLYLGDSTPNGGGATVLVNLWSGSIGNGTLVASTDPVYTSAGLVGTATFLFSIPATLTPGTTYYLQPVVQSGDTMDAGLVPGPYYSNGQAFYGGTFHNVNLWFQEGVVVPEPSSILLSFFGLAGFVLNRRKNQ